MVEKYPTAFGRMLSVVHSACTGKTTVIVVPGNEPTEAAQLLNAAWAHYIPTRCIAMVNEDTQGTLASSLIDGKTAIGGRAAAYVCKDQTCSAPVTTASELEVLLANR